MPRCWVCRIRKTDYEECEYCIGDKRTVICYNCVNSNCIVTDNGWSTHSHGWWIHSLAGARCPDCEHPQTDEILYAISQLFF